MFVGGKGDRVSFTEYRYVDGVEKKLVFSGTIEYTFYEPGDPVMGVSIRDDDGVMHGGVDARDVYPITSFVVLKIEAMKENKVKNG